MTKVIRVSISLIMFFLFTLATIVHAQQASTNCKNLEKENRLDDIKINKIQIKMTRVIESVYEDTIVYFKKQKKSNNQPKRLDIHNRGLNILVLNLGHQVIKMKELLEEVKEQGTNCLKIVLSISDKVNTTQGIHAEMLRSLGNKNTTEHDFMDLIKSLN